MRGERIHRLAEEQICHWFAACDRMTDMALDHPTMGPVPVCGRCLDVIGHQGHIAGWLFSVMYVESGETKEETAHFMSPVRATAEWNVRENIRRWHPQAAILAVEWIESIPPGEGWSSGNWTQTFKRGVES